MSPPRLANRITHLLLDFDETLTTHDTISSLVSLAYHHRPHTLPRLPAWSYFTSSYLSAVPPTPRKTSLAAHLSHLSSPAVRAAESASLARIASHGVFAGLPHPTTFTPTPSTVTFRPGFWHSLIAPTLAQSIPVTVVSVNWDAAWIRGCLRAGVAAEGGDVSAVERVDVRCNNLEVVDGVTTGRWAAGESVLTAEDKVRILRELQGEEGRVCYVGDSETDLRALVEADVGVVVGGRMDGVLAELGVEVVRVGEIAGCEEVGEGLVRVDSMAEVGRLLGLVE